MSNTIKVKMVLDPETSRSIYININNTINHYLSPLANTVNPNTTGLITTSLLNDLMLTIHHVAAHGILEQIDENYKSGSVSLTSTVDDSILTYTGEIIEDTCILVTNELGNPEIEAAIHGILNDSPEGLFDALTALGSTSAVTIISECMNTVKSMVTQAKAENKRLTLDRITVTHNIYVAEYIMEDNNDYYY